MSPSDDGGEGRGVRDTRVDPLEFDPDETDPGSIFAPAAEALEAAETTPMSPPGPPTPEARQQPRPEEERRRGALPQTPAPQPASRLAPVRAPEAAPGGAALRARAPRVRTGWPFLPLAPLLVVVVGLAVAFAIGFVGIDHLARAGDEHAGARAELLAATVGARLGALPEERRLEATQLAARRSAAELLVVDAAGGVIHDATLGAPERALRVAMVAKGSGVARAKTGRARYAVRTIGAPDDPRAPRLIVLVPEPRAAIFADALALALIALAVLLLGVAAAVAYAVSRDFVRDLGFITHRVRTMAQIRTEPTGELVPQRTMDEVGVLTVAFNKLVRRFGIAERAYRGDLARASAADRERAAFLAAVSHELRSPLNAILGFADILMEEVDGPLTASAKEEVEQIRASGAHLLALINDILELSALESGQLRLSRSRADLFALVSEVMREARGLVGDKPLAVRLEGGPLFAQVDARRVRQIVGNLVNNAVKFTQRGEVIVRVAREGAHASVAVSDTGPGISERERAVIFEEYKQARSERVRRRGTGLGLAITRRLVSLHNGTIHLESELGRGATFKVLLPVGDVDARAPASGEPRRAT